jgi:protein-S-isoprenylcysteine O-methyltransferase Ste14
MDATTHGKISRRGFWAAVLFYLLIAFEFFYMASPFAVYFYSVYRPGLEVLGRFPHLAWLGSFFLPHIAAETRSVPVNLHNGAGMALLIAGLGAFLIGAGQVYYRKLTKKGPAVGGVYRFIRHPQYLSLGVSGLGLLFLWPRYIVLATYVTVLFAYYLLARLEERECLVKFGKPYEAYLATTGMFLPVRMPSSRRPGRSAGSGAMRAAAVTVAYLLVMGGAFGAARGVERLSVRSLYASYTPDSATVSLVKMGEADLKRIIETGTADPRVRERLEAGNADSPARYLNYVLPADRYVSEIPMNPIGPDEGNHFLRSGYSGSVYRIVLTRAVPKNGEIAHGREILAGTAYTEPLAEVLVDTGNWSVVGVEDPAQTGRYDGVPMPVF